MGLHVDTDKVKVNVKCSLRLEERSVARCGAHLPSLGVTKLSTSLGCGKGGNVTSAEWQVTLCGPIWHVSSRSGEASC